MDYVVGGGVSGITVADRKGARVIEEKAELGGIHAPVDLGVLKVPGEPVLSDSVCGDFNAIDFTPRIVFEKDEYLEEKICGGSCPKWLTLSNVRYLVLPKFERHSWIRARVRRIVGNRAFTSLSKSLEFDRLYVAAPPQELGLSGGDYVSAAVIIALVRAWDKDWDIKVSGDTSKLYTRLIHVPFGEHHLLYVEKYYRNYPPSWDRIKSDVKRFEKLDLDSISIDFRYRIIKYGILIPGSYERVDLANNVRLCGRFADWTNPGFCESIRLAQEC